MPYERPTNTRLIVLAALAGGAILSYLLRVCISPAGTTVQKELALDDVAMGDIFAAFFLGYFWFQLPAGWAGSRVGARIALGAMGLLWAGATVLSAQSYAGTPLYWSRIALGVAQAGLFPVTIMAIRDWFPKDRHGLASSVITSCMSAGAVLAGALTTRLLAVFGWRTTFLVHAVVTVAWAAWFLAWFRDLPERHRGVNRAELERIRSGAVTSESSDTDANRTAGRGESLPKALGAMLLSPNIWALNAQAYFQAFAYAVFITWFPAYLEKGRGLSVTTSGDLTILPLVTLVIGSLLGGYLIDLIFQRTGRRWVSRSVLPALGLALAAVAAALATTIAQPVVSVGVIALGMFFMGIAMPGKWACTIDLTGAHSATGFALMNMAGNVGAWMCPKVVGHLFQSLDKGGGDWNVFLLLVAGVLMAGALCCLALNPNRPVVGSPRP